MYVFEFVFLVSLDKYPEEELLGPSLSFVIAFVLKSIFSGPVWCSSVGLSVISYTEMLQF